MNPVLNWIAEEQELGSLMCRLIDNCTAIFQLRFASLSDTELYLFFSPSPSCRDLKQLTMTLQLHHMTPS